MLRPLPVSLSHSHMFHLVVPTIFPSILPSIFPCILPYRFVHPCGIFHFIFPALPSIFPSISPSIPSPLVLSSSAKATLRFALRGGSLHREPRPPSCLNTASLRRRTLAARRLGSIPAPRQPPIGRLPSEGGASAAWVSCLYHLRNDQLP